MKIKWNFKIRITLIYLLFGVSWIIFTDFLLQFFIKDIDIWTQVQSVKGIFFVVISAYIIYILSAHYSKQQQKINEHLSQLRKQAEENDRLKSAFHANMSHEIRTPMNGILGFVNLLENSDIDIVDRSRFLGYVKKSSDRLLETINDIIEISKIESNQSIMNFTNVDLNESINYLFGFFQPVAEEKGLSFVLKNEIAGEDIVVYTDKNKLESILINFIKNAIKFTQKGYVEFGCKKQTGTLRFYVKDTGIGIPEEKKNAVFDRFVQADLNITKPYEGSGLGLTIAKTYAELLDGLIWFDTKLGEGSTFWFSLKLKEQNL